jgi:hypothetical protein
MDNENALVINDYPMEHIFGSMRSAHANWSS